MDEGNGRVEEEGNERDGETSEEEEAEQATILYDVVSYREWEQEPEVVKKQGDVLQGKSRGGWLQLAPPPSILPPRVEAIQGAAIPWLFEVSSDGQYIAVLQEFALEVWSSREQYNTLVGRRPVEKDPAPQWRRLQWTEDNSLLAVAMSSGAVEVVDTVGTPVFTIISPCIPASQPGWIDTLRVGPTLNSYCGLFFTTARLREKKWTAELMMVELSGRVISFLVSPSGYQELSTFSIGWSLTSAVLCPSLNLLVTAGGSTCPTTGSRRLIGKASHQGIIALRLLNDFPHFITMLDGEEQEALGRGWSLPWISSAPPSDHITAMAATNCGTRIAAIHESGAVSVWALPSLLLESRVLLTEQPNFDEINPQLLQAPHRKRAKAEFLSQPLRYHPVGLSWWNKEAVVLARLSGALTVLGIQELSNLLGHSPEFLEGVPRISHCLDKGFFGLECETSIKGRRPSSFDDSAGEDPDVELEESDGEEEGLASWLAMGKRGASAVAFYVTDSETFAPPKKKAKIVRKTFRLMGLVATSPEELYSRKIAAEEYGEAILLAQHYGLDTDLVYERQWRRSTKSGAAIQDYLGKMVRRQPVLKEVLETLPEDLDSTRALLEHGLRGTDLEALLALAPGAQEDPQLFVRCDPQRVLEDCHTEEEKEEKERAARLILMSRVNWESLSLVQKDLVNTRRQLLYYRDTLDTLEEILGGSVHAPERFTPSAYARLRRRTPLENCLAAAKSGDFTTVREIFASGTQGPEVDEHWLPILSCAPETLSPAEYEDLLPKIDRGLVPPPWRLPAREQDWAEGPLVDKWVGDRREPDNGSLYLEEMVGLEEWRSSRPSPTLVSTWYEARAREICSQSALPARALELLQFGLQQGVDVDWRLLHHLRTLDCLAYEVQAPPMELAKLEQMAPVDQMLLLLTNWEVEPLSAIRCHLLPFLQRLEDHQQGQMSELLSVFCNNFATTDLSFPLLVVEQSGPDKAGPILYSVVDTIRLAIDCCYALQSGAQLDLMERIVDSVGVYVKEQPATRQTRYNVSRSMVVEVEALRSHLDIASVLSRNGVVRPLALLRDESSNVNSMKKLFAAVLSRAEGARPALDQEGWRLVFRDLQLLQNLLPVVPMEGVVYNYCESLLSSGSAANINLASSVVEGMMGSEEQERLVTTAWRHYYSTSSGINDPVLDLARQVLGLLQPTPRAIDHCYDLLAALQSMEDFGLGHVLPLTILEAKDRLQFVKMAVEARPNAYKNQQRLMKLASLLGVAADSMEGEVWSTIANRALKLGDSATSLVACNNIIKVGFTAGWEVCYALAVRGKFTDLEKARHLLNFAVCHCQPSELEGVVSSLVKVEHNVLEQRLSVGVVGGEEEEKWEEAQEEMDMEATEDGSQERREMSPMELLNIPSLSSQFLSSHLQQTTSWLTRLSSSENSSVQEEDLIDQQFLKVRLPAFYLPPNSKDGEGGLDIAYDNFTQPTLPRDIALGSYHVIRLSGLASTLATIMDNKSSEAEQVITADLLHHALPLIASQDVFLGLLLLLSLTSDSEVVDLLDKLPRSLPGLCFTLTQHSLRLLSSKSPSSSLFRLTPKQVVAKALQLKKVATVEDELPEICLQQIDATLELVQDFQQGAQLSGLSGDVDVARFTSDPQYKEDTILGLAMFIEQENWQFTLSLANRYRVSLPLVAATHLEALLTSPDISCSEVEALVEARKLVELMKKENVKESVRKVEARVLPLVDGADIPRLLNVYSILDRLGSPVEVHLGALSKLQKSGIGLDYSLFTSGSQDILSTLTQKNVEIVAEVVGEVGNGSVTPSTVFGSWAAEAFFQHGRLKENWIEAFSLIQTFVERLQPKDFRELITRCILSHESLGAVPRPARGRIFKKAVKQVEVAMVKDPQVWKETEDWLRQVKVHSERFRTKLSIQVMEELGDLGGEAMDRFEMTGGERTDVMRLLASLVMEEEKVVVEGVMKVWKQDEEVEVGWEELLSAGADQLKEQKKENMVVSEPIKLLEKLANLASPSTLSRHLVPLARDERVCVADRLALVQLLKHLDVQEDEGESVLDSSNLANLYQTQHAIQQILPNFSVAEVDLVSTRSKLNLLEQLLIACEAVSEVQKVAEVAKDWELDSWLFTVARRLLQLDHGSQAVVELLVSDDLAIMNEGEAEKLLEFGNSDGLECAMLILGLGVESSYPKALQVLQKEESCSFTLALLIVRRNLVAELALAPVLPALVNACQEAEDGQQLLEKVIEQLREAEYHPVAASIQMQVEGVPDGLRSLAMMAQRWLKGDP